MRHYERKYVFNDVYLKKRCDIRGVVYIFNFKYRKCVGNYLCLDFL